MKKLIIFSFMFILTINVSILAVTWDGGAGTNNWGDALNWNPNGVPGSGDAVYIHSSINVNIPATCASLTLEASSNNYTFTISNSITVSGDVYINAGTVSGANRTLNVGSGILRCVDLTMENPDNSINSNLIVTISSGWANVSGDITMNGAADENFINITGNGYMIISGNIIGGSLNITNTGTLTIYGDISGSNLNLTAAGTLTIGGNIIGGSLNLTGVGCTVVYTGTTITVRDATYQNLTISGSGTKILGGTTIVASTLKMSGGSIILNSNTLTLGTGETNSTKGTLNWTAGFFLGEGTFKRWFSSSDNITLGNAAGLFPMGHANNFGTIFYNRCVWLGGQPSNGGTLSVQHSDQAGVTVISDFLDGGLTVNRRHNMNWTISAADGFSDNDAQLRLQGTGITGITTVADLRLIRSTDAVGTSSNGTGTTSDPQVNRTDLTEANLSNIFYFGSNNTSNPLPIELTSFTASIKNYSVYLYWETATEVNNYGFEVQRSLTQTLSEGENLSNWEKIGFVEGHGNSNSTKAYLFADKNVLRGKYFYRLKQIDSDGKFEYSKEVEVIVESLPSSFELSQNYPNPFNTNTMISWQSPVGSHQTIKIFDVLGNEVATLANEFRDAGFYEVEFDASSLASGIYYYRLQAGSFVETRKMQLLK